MKPTLVAFGGNALIREHEMGNYPQQLRNVTKACAGLKQVVRAGTPLVITHGNGPQVGNLDLQMHGMVPKIPSMPLNVEVGMTQGEIGHLFFLGLKKWFPSAQISIVPTHILVESKDPAFRKPSKPIGPWYTSRRREWKAHEYMHDVRHGFRKLVPSPQPQKIMELDTIRSLLGEGNIVIACGGGGIPIAKRNGVLAGVEGVIDKDYASALLGSQLRAESLSILTNERNVCLDYHSRRPQRLTRLSTQEAKAYLAHKEFGAGSMQPKIEAALRFLQKGGKRVQIGHTNETQKVMAGEAGTRIHP